jgi:hypothetical protein
MVILAVAVLASEPVTVTVYVPGVVKLFASVVGLLPPLQLYEMPPVAVTLMALVVHVNIVVPVLFVMLATGGGNSDFDSIPVEFPNTRKGSIMIMQIIDGLKIFICVIFTG